MPLLSLQGKGIIEACAIMPGQANEGVAFCRI